MSIDEASLPDLTKHPLQQVSTLPCEDLCTSSNDASFGSGGCADTIEERAPSVPAHPLGNIPRLLRSVLKRATGTWNHPGNNWIIRSLMLLTLLFPAFAKPISLTVKAQSTSGHPHTISARAVETILALLSIALITFTYTILINTSHRLSNTSKLPMACISKNIMAILEQAWPDTSSSTQCLVPDGTQTDAIRLLYCGEMDQDATKGRIARGVLQCEANPDKRLHTPRLWLTNGSSSTSNMVQVMVWEWVFVWMGLWMLIITLLHNGFIGGKVIGPDGFLRLAVVLAYLVAYAAHVAYVWWSCTTWLTNVAAGASWSMLNRARFAVIDKAHYEHHLKHQSERGPLKFREISKASKEFVQEYFEAELVHDAYAPQVDNYVSVKASTTEPTARLGGHGEHENALRNIESAQAVERSNTVTAAANSLDLIVANGMLLVAVNISSGFFLWTAELRDSQNSRLGSLWLLTSLSLGVVAMFTSAVYLQTTNASFKELLLLKEILINGQAEEFSTKRPLSHRPISFMQGVKAQRVRMRDLFETVNTWSILCFMALGPGYFLLPTKDDQDRKSKETEYELPITVRGHPVVLTTAGTDRHSRDEEGKNIHAVNVFYVKSPLVKVFNGGLGEKALAPLSAAGLDGKVSALVSGGGFDEKAFSTENLDGKGVM